MCSASELEMKCCLIMAKTANDSFMFLQLREPNHAKNSRAMKKNRANQNLKVFSFQMSPGIQGDGVCEKNSPKILSSYKVIPIRLSFLSFRMTGNQIGIL